VSGKPIKFLPHVERTLDEDVTPVNAHRERTRPRRAGADGSRNASPRARDQFETLYAEGAKSARVMAIAVHPYISGVPHRIKYFDRIYAYLRKKKGVLFWTGEDLLNWYRGHRG